MQGLFCNFSKMHGSFRKFSSNPLFLTTHYFTIRYDDLLHSLDKISSELLELKAHKHETERDIQLFETARNLKLIFPTVYGRMSELCGISQEKYRVAVTVAMGRFVDAIVVQDESSGKECIKYLKEQRLPAQSFIPIESVRVKPVTEKLRTLGGTAKLVIDVMQFERKLEKAVLYAIGDTLVCDELDEAKALSWSNGEQYRVVACDGTLFTKSGTMTGGMTEFRSKKWDHGKIEELKEKKAQIEAELVELKSPRDLQKDEFEVYKKITGLESKIHHLKVEENNLSERLLQLESEKAAINEHISHIKPELQKLTSLISKKKEEAEKLDKQINEIIDTIYNDFSISVGAKNICEYEDNQLVLQEKKLKLHNQITALKYQLEYEQKRDMKTPVVKLASTHDSLNDQLNNLLETESNAELEIQKILEEIDNIKASHDEWKAKLDEYDIELKNLITKNADITADITKLESEIKSKEGVMERMEQSKQDIHKRCEIEQLEIDKIMEIDKNEDDFNFKQTIDFLTAEIERTSPNLKSLNQYEVLLKKENDVSIKYEAARKEEKEITDKLNSVRQKSFRPSPFFILDEVDAALDNLNVSKLASYIRSKSCTDSSENDPGFQSIVISHKDSFYGKAESLIGVYKDIDINCSRMLTFDLTRCNED